MAERVTSGDFQEKVLASSGLTLVDFYSDTCMPCKRMFPVLAALEEQYREVLSVKKVNIAYDRELVNEYQVRSTPTLLFFRGGAVVERCTGVRRKQELDAMLERLLSGADGGAQASPAKAEAEKEGGESKSI